MHRPADRPRRSSPPTSGRHSGLPSPLVGGALAALAALAACGGREAIRSTPETAAALQESGAGVAAETDESAALPRMLNAEPPFHYPPALWARQVQGNVVLRLFIDELGRVVPESTRVAEPSGYAALDSAAVRGSESLRFAPAKRDGTPVGAPMLFPVHFRHPQAKPLPGDSVGGRP
jgi:TonB family protein